MLIFEAEGVIGTLIYLSCLSDKYQLSLCEIYEFNQDFLARCNKVERCVSDITREDVVNLCSYHSDFLTFDQVSNSVFIKKDNNAVIIGLYYCTMYLEGTGAKMEFNDAFDKVIMKKS